MCSSTKPVNDDKQVCVYKVWLEKNYHQGKYLLANSSGVSLTHIQSLIESQRVSLPLAILTHSKGSEAGHLSRRRACLGNISALLNIPNAHLQLHMSGIFARGKRTGQRDKDCTTCQLRKSRRKFLTFYITSHVLLIRN